MKSVKAIEKCEELQEENIYLKQENKQLKEKNYKLINYIYKVFEVITNVFKVPKIRVIEEIKNYIKYQK